MPTRRSVSAQQAAQPPPTVDATDVMRQLDRLEQILAEAESRRTAALVEPQQLAVSPIRAMDLEERQRFVVFLAGLTVSAAYSNVTAGRVKARPAVIGNRPVVAPAAAVVNRNMDTMAAVVNRPVEDASGARGTRI